MDIDKIVEDAVKEHCKKQGFSNKLTKLMLDLTNKYRNEGTVGDEELLNYIKRINKNMSSGE